MLMSKLMRRKMLTERKMRSEGGSSTALGVRPALL